jgi:YVTN family beta-propeller protein
MVRNLVLFVLPLLLFLFQPVSGQVEETDPAFPVVSDANYLRTRGEGTPISGVKKGKLVLQKVIGGDIRPRSIAYAGNGRFFAQNMMHRHSITVYDRNFKLVGLLDDEVNLSLFQAGTYEGIIKGAPVQAAFTADGRFAWVSNYHVTGREFTNPGNDNCLPGQVYDNSFLYKIDTRTLKVLNVVEVGCVPKHVSITPDNRLLLVSNWCSSDLSLIDLRSETEIKRISLGRYPLSIAIDSKSRYAYVSVMGEDQVAIIKLTDGSITWIDDVGDTPHQLCLGSADRYLYISLDREGMVKKYDLIRSRVAATVKTGKGPRSMTLSQDGKQLYVANYSDNTLCRIATASMQINQTISTNAYPIGMTFDPEKKTVWLACYDGSIMVFEDQGLQNKQENPTNHIAYRPLNNEAGDATTYVPGLETRSEDPNYYLFREETQKSRNVSPPANDVSVTSNGYVYHVILGSYRNKKAADQLVLDLREMGLRPEIIPTDKGNYRVSGQSFATHAAARKAVNSLREKNMDSWIWKTKR